MRTTLSHVPISLRPSVTRRYCVETAKHIIKLFHHRVATSFNHTKRYGTIPTETPNGGVAYRGYENRDLFSTNHTLFRKQEAQLSQRDRAKLRVIKSLTRRSTLGDRAFPVASARAWNSLPSSVRNAPPLTTFRRELKTVLFQSSFDND